MAKCPRNAFPRRSTVTRFSRDAFPGALPWQDSAAVCSRAAIRGKFCAPCIPKGAPDGKIAPSWQDSRAVHPKRAGFGKMCAPCIRKAPQTAVGGCTARISCQEGALFAARAPRIMHGARILPSASDCNHGAALMGGGTGRGRLLVGRGGAAKGVRGAVGHRALTEKPASAKRRLRISNADRLAESREPAFAGRVQGGAAARRRLSSDPAERGLLAACGKVVSAPHKLCRQLLRRAVRALGTSFCRAHILPRHMACCPRARNLQHSAR